MTQPPARRKHSASFLSALETASIGVVVLVAVGGAWLFRQWEVKGGRGGAEDPFQEAGRHLERCEAAVKTAGQAGAASRSPPDAGAIRSLKDDLDKLERSALQRLTDLDRDVAALRDEAAKAPAKVPPGAEPEREAGSLTDRVKAWESQAREDYARTAREIKETTARVDRLQTTQVIWQIDDLASRRPLTDKDLATLVALGRQALAVARDGPSRDFARGVITWAEAEQARRSSAR